MSGHQKFANIKHKKEKNDAKKVRFLQVIGRELVMAVKQAVRIRIITANFVM